MRGDLSSSGSWSRISNLIAGLALVLLTAVLQTIPLAAQTMLSDFTGVVSDPSGAAIPDATVTVTNQVTMAKRTAATDVTGTYHIQGVEVSTYSLEVEARGFKKYIQTDIVVQSGIVKPVDVKLEIGTETQTVKVTSNVAVIQTDSATVATGLPDQVRDLPIAPMSRGALIMEQLVWAPGSAAGGVYTYNGNRGDFNQYNIEGLQFNSISATVSASMIQTVDVVLSNASAEYARPTTINATLRSGTNQYHAEYWRDFANPCLNAVRNQFSVGIIPPHGGPCATAWRQFLTASGPIQKDKTFFFYSWARPNSFNLPVLGSLESFPTLAMQSGDFSNYPATIIDPTTGNPFPSNKIPDDRISSVSKAIMNQFMGNTVNYLGGPNNYINNVDSPAGRFRQDNDQNVKIDRNQGTKDIISGFYQNHRVTSNDQWNNPITGASNPFQTTGQDLVYNWGAGISETHTFSSNIVNELRTGAMRFVYTHGQMNSWQKGSSRVNGSSFVSAWGLQGVATPDVSGMPQIAIAGWERTYSDDETAVYDTRYSVYDNLSIVKGRNTIKFGYSAVKLLYDTLASGPYFGAFNFSNLFTGAQVANAGVCPSGVTCGDAFADFLLGLPASDTRYEPRPVIAERKWEHGAFFQDDIHISGKLMVNIGLRWVHYTVPYDKNGLYYNFDPLHQEIVVPDAHALANVSPTWPVSQFPIVLASQDSYPKKLFNGTSSWQPRFGFVYQLLPKTVLRGGYGLYNGANEFGQLQTYGPFVNEQSFTNVPVPGSATGALYAWPNAFPSSNQLISQSGVTGYSKNYKEAITHNYNVTLEREVLPNWGLQFTYRGVFNRGLLWEYNFNEVPPSTTPWDQSLLPYPALSNGGLPFVENGADSWYQGLEWRLSHLWSKGFYSTISYTRQYSGGLDPGGWGYASDQEVVVPESPFNRDRDNQRILGEYPRNDFLWNWVGDLPVGRGKRFAANPNKFLNGVIGNWRFSGVFSWHSGLGFTPETSGVDFSNTGMFGGRPDMVAGCNPYSGARNVKGMWFNPACYAIPAAGTLGNTPINSLIGPGAWVLSLTPFKEFPLRFREGASLRFGAEIYNLFNHPVYGPPNAVVNAVNAGVITSPAGAARGYCCTDSTGQRKVVVNMRVTF